MCLLVLAWQVHPKYRLVVAANRDEYHERPAAALAPWPAPDRILAGRDLRGGGTWLGLDRTRRFGVVTNFRDRQRPRRSAPTRGALIPAYLSGSASAADYLAGLETDAPGYSGFNLLLSDADALWYASNRAERFARPLEPGVYGLSNEFLDTPWPKLQRVRGRFQAWLREPSGTPSSLFEMLNDREPTPDADLPHTGLPVEWERTLSSPFVLDTTYGTRCSTVLALEASGAVYLAERRFDSAGLPSGQAEYQLNDREWP
jgi:uncharacterized protein with NRDE domain